MINFLQTSAARLAWCWLPFLAVVVLHGVLTAPLGIENNDSGFILGLAHQLFLGGALYEDIIYIRPPVTPLLHATAFLPPLSSAPVYADRLLTLFEIAMYSGLSAVLAGRLFAWRQGFVAGVAALVFLFSMHTQAPMAWHTIDGILFSVLAIFLLHAGVAGRGLLLPLAAACAVLAAGAKQSFYPVPLLLPVLTMLVTRSWRNTLVVVAWEVVAALLLLGVVSMIGSVPGLLSAVSSQTTAQDLFVAGFSNYARDVITSRSLFGVWPLLLVLFFAKPWRGEVSWRSQRFLLAAAWLFVVAIFMFYRDKGGGVRQPAELVDTLFVGTALFSVLMLARTRETAWAFVVGLHAIAWCASISWGVMSTMMYAAPPIITVAWAIATACERSSGMRLAALALIPAAWLAFHEGGRDLYSLEEPARREEATIDMADAHPCLRLIKGTPGQFGNYRELAGIISQLSGRNYVVLPNMPLAHVLTGTANPIGIDWAMDAEVGKQGELAWQRMGSRVDYAVVFNAASPAPELSGKYGSQVTMRVKQQWVLLETTGRFSIYGNPSRAGASLAWPPSGAPAHPQASSACF